MLFIYNIGIKLYVILISVVAIFNKKANKWIVGRTNCYYEQIDQSVWFHFASLGEFEQGRPVLELYSKLNPTEKIVITFFSPSGYEIRKNTPLAHSVYYLPVDTAINARNFIKAIQPKKAIFTKYEYWYHFFNELNEQNIPLYVISAIFRPRQIFFKWYGTLHRKMLSFVSCFFVQDEQSVLLLESVGINNCIVSGDTRFDRVWQNVHQMKQLPVIIRFKNNRQLFIAGSTWPQDETILVPLMKSYPEWKFIFAPHEIGDAKINQLVQLLPPGSAIKYSEIDDNSSPLNYQVLIIDNIGLLSSLYQYGDIAYIGGGFGAGIHNTLEAAAFGLPVIFGPNYARFKEANDLISLKTGFSIGDGKELKDIILRLADWQTRSSINQKAKSYVEDHTGATNIIVDYIQNNRNK